MNGLTTSLAFGAILFYVVEVILPTAKVQNLKAVILFDCRSN